MTIIGMSGRQIMSFLQGLFRPPNVDELKSKGDVKGLIKALEYKKDVSVQQDTINALAGIGEPAVLPLVTAIENGGPETRRKAPEALGKIGAPAVEPLISSLREFAVFGEKDIDACTAITTALGEVGAPAVEPLISVLREQNKTADSYMLRDFVTDALGQVGVPAIEPLVAALRDSDWSLRGNAAKTLGKIGDVRAVELLIASLQDHLVRVEAITALGKIGDKRAVDPLIQILSEIHALPSGEYKQGDDKLVLATIEALGRLGDIRAEQPIIAASEKWLEDHRVALKSMRDAAAQLGRPDFGKGGIWEAQYNNYNKVVQDALARLQVHGKESKAGIARANRETRKAGEDHQQAVQHLQAGIDLIKSQKWDQAILELSKTVETEPGFAKAHQLLAIAYGGKLDRESAVKHFQILLTLDSSMAKELEDNPLFAMILRGGVNQT
jgi:HEAT repeat protein